VGWGQQGLDHLPELLGRRASTLARDRARTSLVPLGTAGSVEVGGVPLEEVRFTGSEITGRLRSLPQTMDVTVDLGITRLPAVPLRVATRPLLLPPDQAMWIVGRLRRLLGER
jgi:hypothetical protein